MVHLLLGQLLKDDRPGEAEDHLNQAKAMTTDAFIQLAVEKDLGDIAMDREQYDEALQHFNRVAELEPGSGEAWYDIAETYNLLENVEEAANKVTRGTRGRVTRQSRFRRNTCFPRVSDVRKR